jgi:hypothetical protein
VNWSSPKQFAVTADFSPPAGSAGQPYAGPYVVKQVVIGDRFNSDRVLQQPADFSPVNDVPDDSVHQRLER